MEHLSLSELVELHKLYRRPSEATYRNYERIQRQFTRETGIAHLSDFYQENFKTRMISWRNLIVDRSSPITFNNYLTHLRALVNFAIQEELIDQKLNPLLKIGKLKHTKPTKKVVKISFLSQCIEFLSGESEIDSSWWWKIAINFLYTTGVRRSQLVNVQWKDIDYRKKLLNTSSNKSKKEWVIPLSDEVINDLQYLLQRTMVVTGGNLNGEDYVFRVSLFNPRFKSSDESGKMHPDQLTQTLSRTLSSKMGVKISPHRLRHTMGTMIANDPEVKETGRMKALQQIMGHASVTTTFGYVHPDMKELRKTQSRLPKIA